MSVSKFALVADEATRRHVEHEAIAATTRGPHLLQFTLTLGELLDDDAGVLLVDVDDDFFDRFEASVGFFVGFHHNLRT